jgi:hypothetical protein
MLYVWKIKILLVNFLMDFKNSEQLIIGKIPLTINFLNIRSKSKAELKVKSFNPIGWCKCKIVKKSAN